MSYILDALKKSEQERGNGSVPGVQTIHSSSINYHQDKRAIWPWFLLAAVIINIVALVYFMQGKNSAGPVAPVQNPVAPVEVAPAFTRQSPETPASPAAQPLPAVVEQSVSPEQPMNQQVYIPESPVRQQAEQTVSEAVDFHDLPLNIRQHIPELDFSAHVYSSSAQQRSLVINGRFMEEGEQVNNDVTLVEITREGAIFDYRGQRFKTSVLSGWN